MTLEWRMYDRGELFAVWEEHGALVDRYYCDRCNFVRTNDTCEQLLTDAYHNLMRNLAVVIALAAAREGR